MSSNTKNDGRPDLSALLVDEILPHQPMRQWVLSVLFPLRFLLASQPAVMGKVLGIVYRAIATHLTRKAGYTDEDQTPAERLAAMTWAQRWKRVFAIDIA